MKIFFLDLETTGTDREKHGIHQISGAIVINGEVKEHFNFRVRPHPSALIDFKALEVCGITFNQIQQYPEMPVVFSNIVNIISKYTTIDDDKDKFFIAGYNSQSFDGGHFAKWFQRNSNLKLFNKSFWTVSLDVMILAQSYLMNVRHEMENFKQNTVARKLGIEVDDSKLHDAEYDIDLCMSIYNIVCGKY